MAKYMPDLELNLKSNLKSEIEKVTQPPVSQVAALEDKLESYEARFVALNWTDWESLKGFATTFPYIYR